MRLSIWEPEDGTYMLKNVAHLLQNKEIINVSGYKLTYFHEHHST
jgi:hypothetical protein